MYFDASKHLTEEAIALYVDALKLKATDRLPQEVREHVSGCRQCKQAILELEWLVDDRQYANIRSHPTLGKVGERRKFLTVYRVAASIIVVAGLGTAAYLLGVVGGGRIGEQPLPSAGKVEKAVQPETSNALIQQELRGPERQKEAIAANFAPSANLEGVVGGALRSEEVVVTSPKIGEVVGEKIAFRWTTGIKPPYTVKILNNREGEEKVVSVRTSAYDLQNEFADGLYYWKLEARGELLYVGKFLVKNR